MTTDALFLCLFLLATVGSLALAEWVVRRLDGGWLADPEPMAWEESE